MYEEGFQNVINIDFCPGVVEIMKEYYKSRELNFQCTYTIIVDLLMDVRNMSAFRDKDFEVVFDKGTLDCVYVTTIILLHYYLSK